MPLLKRSVLLSFLLLSFLSQRAATITGTVTDEKGAPLSFASVTVKGQSKGAVANSQGRYSLSLGKGTYVLECHHVGYRSSERPIQVEEENLVLDFQLTLQEFTMPEVVIRRGEDPAIGIMRQVIKKREAFNRQVDSFTVDVYIKGLVRSRAIPDKVLGQKVDKTEMARQGVDAAGKGILFLSESLTKVAFKRPDKIKMEVVSSRESGGSGFGLSVPFFVNFYTNNVQLFADNLLPRGFVSPLADGAFHYYQFHYEGNFFEGDRMIDRIRVTPRRKNEPLFEGFVQVIDGEWRLHSLSLVATKQYGLDLLDTVRITQLHAPVGNDTWRTQNQVVSFAASLFGIDLAGDFLNVYTNYNLAPGFKRKFFDRILMRYDTAFNQHDSLYWSRLRPVPLELDERHDFLFKDSVRKANRPDSLTGRQVDSLRKSQKPPRFSQFFRGGVTRNRYARSNVATYRFEPLLTGLHYNTVEGVSLSLQQSLSFSANKSKRDFVIGLNTRYGFSNTHLNLDGSFTLRSKEEAFRAGWLRLSGGKKLQQFNRDNPIDEFSNSVSTLFYRRNYLKVYEAWFGNIDVEKTFENGLRLQVQGSYEDRIPVENTSDFSFFYKQRQFTPNHPYELSVIPFERHSATVASVSLTYQPGQRYIQLPNRKIPIGSNLPTFGLQYHKGVPGMFGSTADFDKWAFSVSDNANLKMLGLFKYRFGVGGFLNNRHVDLPDFTHFNGNQTVATFQYVNSFQLAPYYRYSNTENVYTVLHAEHHFNGLLTNKIPLFNKLKWNLVAGTNTFYVNRDNYYVEAFAGLENIFKIFRVDFVTATQAALGNAFGVRIGLGGVIGNGIRFRR